MRQSQIIQLDEMRGTNDVGPTITNPSNFQRKEPWNVKTPVNTPKSQDTIEEEVDPSSDDVKDQQQTNISNKNIETAKSLKLWLINNLTAIEILNKGK